MANEVAEKKEFTTSLSQWVNTFTDLITRDYEACGVTYDDYSKKCAMNAMTEIYNMVKTNPKVDINRLDTSNLRSIVEYCASHKLNAMSYPRECYFSIRSVKVGDSWQQIVEVGIEGQGYDTLLAKFGRDVERVYPYWIVKEGDTYIPPKHKGIETTPPEWEEKGLSEKAVIVVYPIMLTDGTITYLIADRDSVKVNLMSHIKQNMINATFGICADRYKATDKQKEEIKKKKEEILNEVRKCSTVDEMLECEIARPFISGAWLDSSESMIRRKMCNNATRKFPKDYDAVASKSEMEIDTTYREVQEEIETNANSVEFIEQDISENANKEEFVVADVVEG
jgi:hypothetical protein